MYSLPNKHDNDTCTTNGRKCDHLENTVHTANHVITSLRHSSEFKVTTNTGCAAWRLWQAADIYPGHFDLHCVYSVMGLASYSCMQESGTLQSVQMNRCCAEPGLCGEVEWWVVTSAQMVETI